MADVAASNEIQQVQLADLILNSKDFMLKMQVLVDEGREKISAQAALREFKSLLEINLDEAYRLLIAKLRAQDQEFDNFCRLNCRADGDFFVPLIKEFLKKYQQFVPPMGIMQLLSEKVMQGGARGNFYFDFENLKILQDDELRSMIFPEAIQKWCRVALDRVKEKKWAVDSADDIWKVLEDQRFAQFLPRDLTTEFINHQILNNPRERDRVLKQQQLLAFGSEETIKQGLLDSYEKKKDRGMKDLGKEEYKKFFTETELRDHVSDFLCRCIIESRFGEFYDFAEAFDALNDIRGRDLYKQAFIKSMRFALQGGDVFAMIAAMKSARIQQAIADPALAEESVIEASLERALELEGEDRVDMLKRAKSFLGKEDAEKFLLQFLMDRAMTGDFESIRQALHDSDLNSDINDNPFVVRTLEQEIKTVLDGMDFKGLKRILRDDSYGKYKPEKILQNYLTRYLSGKVRQGNVDLIIRILKEPGMMEHVDFEAPELAPVKKLLNYMEE